MEFYVGVLIVENMLPREYFEHYLTYMIALRLLTQEKIEEEDITDAFTLLNYFRQIIFFMRFEKLYGLEHMTYKIHSLTHLALQVLNFGPLHKHAAFHFEGNYCSTKLIQKNKIFYIITEFLFFFT
jgi:hypothetical protein